MSKLDPLFSSELARAQARRVRRRLRTASAAAPGRLVLEGEPVLNFSSNDYLGLSRHPLLVERSREWAARHGAGAQASRLVTGNLDLHEQVEAKLARLKGTEAALLLASGWQANAAVLPALLRAAASQGEVELYADKLNHASLHHGCQAAGVKQIRFRHNDLAHLESLLAAKAESAAGQPVSRFIVTESVFSMDGDRTDVERLATLADRYRAFVYLDEAHATGVLGPRGMGLAGLAPGRIDLAMGTFSKALGGFGAYVAGSRALCDYLINACSGFIYTTALPPAVLGAMDAALDLVPTLDAERARLAAAGDNLRAALRGMGLDTGASSTQIVPAIVGDEARALELASGLEQRGLLAVAIRPPTVPAGTSRLRVTLSAAHRDVDVARLIDGFAAALA
ncbi:MULTISPECIES: aminotransferase class I/II-fold pyridoxal phosphate-dependent enzyme [Achromobacter]|uniref:8-amino-7-oxononanoate synthase n=1 Tax=Alcaligenes xylosoxydans xylosoxydans TaxID=85698 RepID=A0A424WER0_ALCXX|nr:MULTISPECIES: aminotransferase class I/II-fold pyridoxal phosphate-dependent enzyme [Achromobacter]MBC9904482.1 8-amino-7-oxononanoate synthase [Achromobacter xylosoxidans]MBD0869427.1 8-amino-7-oxononanoate synthase [Achromobacter xylosoxidans]QNP88033.1 8-amino-7-oxononanoate synthase [Achromobacter xylosoxidans]RPJ91732.1 8-amino-7-oxononanoate synthase [Achromobacter xylosoxidans]WLW63969.1 aminotransferase class I/II-fold pyridoxal phosphate-dependent enzyme [Achromobacter aegrifaciens